MRFDHVSLSVADLDRQRAFYASALGMVDVEEELALPEAAVRTAILRSPDGLKIELIERGGSTASEYADAFDAANHQSYGHWAVTVEDLQSAFNAILACGAAEVSEPAPGARAGTRFAYVKDPEGNLIELIQPAA